MFTPCGFTNIQGYPHDIPYEVINAIDELPIFKGDNAFSAETNLENFSLFMSKWHSSVDYEDMKMKIFILTLGEDDMDWFLELPNKTFDSLQSVIDSFEDKYGGKEKLKAKVEVKEISEAENDLIKELTQMVKDTQLNQAQLIKNMELNQARFTREYTRKGSSMKANHITPESSEQVVHHYVSTTHSSTPAFSQKG